MRQRCFKRKKIKFLLVLLILVAIIISFACYFKSVIEPVFAEACLASVNSLAVKALNDAANLSVEAEYSDFFTIETVGGSEFMKSNTLLINQLTRQILANAQSELDKIRDKVLMVPFGTLTGMTMFTGLGPDVKIKLMPIGAAKCEFVSQFEEAGINQTRHSLLLNLTCDVEIISPLTNITSSAQTEVLICDNVIVGEVPEVYANFDMLDLLP